MLKSLLRAHYFSVVSNTRDNRLYRSDIDGLRGVSVLLVVLFHAFPTLSSGGFVGVDVFFVISGYLITTIILNSLAKGDFTFTHFYSRRVKRIFPALVLVLISCIILGWFSLLPDEFEQLGKHIVAGAGFILNIILIGEAGYFDSEAETKPLLHLWSLSIEEQYYLIWPILVVLFFKKKMNGFILTLIIAIFSFSLNCFYVKAAPVKTFYFPATRFWELMIGSLLAYINVGNLSFYNLSFYKKLRFFMVSNTNINNLKSVIGIILILVAAFGIDKKSEFPGYLALLPTLGGVLLISAGSTAWVNNKILLNPFLRYMGVISFPLYLWHWPLLSFARIMESDTPNLSIRLIAVMISIFLAWTTTAFIESKIRFGKDKNYKVITPLLFLIFTFILGLVIQKQKGFPGRFSHMIEMNEQLKQLVRNDKTNNACLDLFNTAPLSFPYCIYHGVKNSNKEIVALIGDSHAHVLYPGLQKMLERKGLEFILLANTGCPPLKGFLQTGSGIDDLPKCENRINNILEILTKDKNISDRIKTVIITTRGAGYIHQTGYGKIEGGQTWLIDYSDPSLKNKSKADAFATALLNTVEVLSQKKKKVIYVMENPELGFDVRSCINRPLKISNKSRNCSIELSKVLKRQETYRLALSKINHPNLTLVDPLNIFCSSKSCSPIIDGQVLYADDDHLSINGSVYLTEKFLEIYF